eukprot:1230182-Rhodomonas_salina.4
MQVLTFVAHAPSMRSLAMPSHVARQLASMGLLRVHIATPFGSQALPVAFLPSFAAFALGGPEQTHVLLLSACKKGIACLSPALQTCTGLLRYLPTHALCSVRYYSAWPALTHLDLSSRSA